MAYFKFLGGLIVAVMGTHAAAAVSVVDYYRLGENDAGASSGSAGAATTLDASGNASGANSLAKVGSPTYTSSVSPVAAARTGSTLAFDIPGSGNSYVAPAVVTSAIDNFGVEGWFNPDTADQGALAYSGNTATSGFGLFVVGGKYQGLYGGKAFLDSGVAVTPGAWTYFALVRDGGVNKLYIDNATPIVRGGDPNAGAGSTSIGANGGGGDAYAGLADEVRFFTFAPGSFDASTDLLISVPEPTSTGLLLTAGLGLLARTRRRRA